MITIVKADDWIGIYKDDDLLYENHSIDADELLRVLGIEYKYISAENYLYEHGNCPDSLKDVVPDEE